MKKLFLNSYNSVRIKTNYLLIMKLMIVLMLVGTLQTTANVYSQETKMDLAVTDKSIKEVLREIEKQTEFHFLYNDDFLDLDRIVTISVRERSIKDIMLTLLEDANLTFKVLENNLVVITPAHLLYSQQQNRVNGTVTDAATGEPLPGVNILIDGTLKGVITDAFGRYSLDVENQDVVLVFSYIGYLTEKIAVEGRTVIDLTMSPDVKLLEEVVVVGYGVQKKATVTGAISELKTTDLSKNSVADVTNSITGRIAGVITVQGTGQVGDDGATLFIRGQSTFNDNSPLILVDGIERPFNRIDPNNIESMSVLKDASATAVYGVRGANGVILITTKRGKESKPTVTYSGYYGIQNPIRIPKYLNSYDYATLYNEAQLNDGVDPSDLAYSDEDIQKYKDHSDPYTHPDVDWNKERLRENVPIQRHSISMTGGSTSIRYFASFGILDQDGVIPNNNYKNYSVRTNIDADITKTTKLSINLAGSKENVHFPGTQGQAAEYSAFSSKKPNLQPVKWENGLWATISGGNPIAADYLSGYRNRGNNSLQTSFILEQKLDFIINGLAVKVLGAYDADFYKEKHWLTSYDSYQKTPDGEYVAVGTGVKASLWENFYQGRSSAFETHLTYNKTFGNHEVSGLLLYTQSAYYNDSFEAGRTEYASSAIDQLFAGPTLNPTNYGWGSESGREGLVGRVTYAFDSKYLLEANFGYNGSENFPVKKRYGFFPSAAVGWVISKEDFFGNVDFISILKIRASYGEVGNDKIGGRRFLYKQPFTYGGGYVFGGNNVVPVQSITPGGLANPDVTWERAKKSNIGIDIRFFDDIIGFKADAFYEKRDNILWLRDQSIPATFGAELPVENFARVDNHGFELELTHTYKIGDVHYNIGGNFTFARNEVMFIDEPENVPEWQKRTGLPMGQFFGYVAEGLYMTEEQVLNHPKLETVDPRLGDIMYKDVNDDGVINDLDRTSIGYSRTPEIVYGINGGIRYKGFDFSALIQGVARSSVYFDQEGAWEFLFGSNPLEHVKGRWRPDGSNSNPTYPRLSTFRDQYKKEFSSYWLRNGAYWRLRNIEIGYTLPNSVLTKMGIGNFRIYASATNPYTHAKFKDWDPEAPGGAGYYFPQMKVYNIGVNVTF